MSNYKVIEKGYRLNLDKLDEGYLSSEQTTHASTRNKARLNLWDSIKYDNWELIHPDQKVTYLNIPICRDSDSDLCEFEGKQLSRWKIKEILRENERLDKLQSILDDDKITHCYIYKGSYYRPNSCGYTDMKHRAGVYTKQEAVICAKFCAEITPIPIDRKEHNEMINSEIEELKDRLIS